MDTMTPEEIMSLAEIKANISDAIHKAHLKLLGLDDENKG